MKAPYESKMPIFSCRHFLRNLILNTVRCVVVFGPLWSGVVWLGAAIHFGSLMTGDAHCLGEPVYLIRRKCAAADEQEMW